MPNVRFAELSERPQVEALSAMDKAVRDFKFNWTRWGHWDEGNFPIIAEEDGQVVGFHAAVFNKRNGYVNSYFQFTHPSHRGIGLGAAMVGFILHNAPLRNCVRLKFQTPIDSPGQSFWQGFGLLPFGRSKTHLFFDVEISGVNDLYALTQLRASKYAWEGIPNASKKRYQSAGLTLFRKEDEPSLI